MMIMCNFQISFKDCVVMICAPVFHPPRGNSEEDCVRKYLDIEPGGNTPISVTKTMFSGVGWDEGNQFQLNEL